MGDLKIAICHPFLYTRGGAERVVLKIAQHFDAKIYCSIYDKEKTFSEFEELEIEVLKPRITRILPHQLPKRVRDAAIAGHEFYDAKLKDYDIVNAQGTPSEWIRHKNLPVIWYCHTPNREAFDLYEWRMSKRNFLQKSLYHGFIQPYKFLEFQTVPKIEFIFANSRNTQARIKQYLHRESEVLNPGVDYENFFCKKAEKFFFYPSRIAPEKRFEIAIEAFKLFAKKNKGWKLIIAGALMQTRKEHVEYYEKIKKLLGSGGEIILDVSEEQLVDLYARCAAVLYTPVNEDFGIIPLEAGAASKACIAINEGGPREVITQKTGFLVNSGGEVAQKMQWIAQNMSEAENKGRSARKHIVANFSWKKFLKRFEKVAKELAESK